MRLWSDMLLTPLRREPLATGRRANSGKGATATGSAARDGSVPPKLCCSAAEWSKSALHKRPLCIRILAQPYETGNANRSSCVYVTWL
jgi:hypothetical protein